MHDNKTEGIRFANSKDYARGNSSLKTQVAVPRIEEDDDAVPISKISVARFFRFSIVDATEKPRRESARQARLTSARDLWWSGSKALYDARLAEDRLSAWPVTARSVHHDRVPLATGEIT
jgi:hypothetical protein